MLRRGLLVLHPDNSCDYVCIPGLVLEQHFCDERCQVFPVMLLAVADELFTARCERFSVSALVVDNPVETAFE